MCVGNPALICTVSFTGHLFLHTRDTGVCCAVVAPHGNLQVLRKLPANFVQADAILLSLVTLHSPSRTLFSTSSDVNSARDIINNILYVAEICIAGDVCETWVAAIHLWM